MIIVPKDNKILVIAGSVVLTEFAGAISSMFALSGLMNWYPMLIKPGFNPPDWIFAPVWILMFLLMGVSLGFVLLEQGKAKKKALTWFVIQFVTNVLWSLFFFLLHSPLLGLIDIFLMLVSIGFTIREFEKIKPIAAWLLMPYLLWVCFAGILNSAILGLN